MALKKGDRIPLKLGGEIKVLKRLGGGMQGNVYKVDYLGNEYALKWYKPSYLKDLNKRHNDGRGYFVRNLENNINRNSPNNKFLWPIAITEEFDGSFGYIMKLRPNEYSDFTDIYNTKDKKGNPVAFKTFGATVESALGIVKAFGDLHSKGYFYLDLNDGNFFINTADGDVLICDNDNVTTNPIYNLGKPGYIAPELVCGNARSNALTDAHSLAVILFRLFMRHDPLMGKKYCSSVLISASKDIELYGTNPIFIFDPENDSNRPVLNVHSNPIKLWPIYPQYIKDAFVRTFCEGMKNPAKRIVEGEWSRLLLRLNDDILICPSCKYEMLWFDKSDVVICPKCKKSYVRPCNIEVNGYYIPVFPGKKIFSTHLDDDFTTRRVYGAVIASRKNPEKLGLKNLSSDLWQITNSLGEKVTKKEGETFKIVPGMEIELPENQRCVISR